MSENLSLPILPILPYETNILNSKSNSITLDISEEATSYKLIFPANNTVAGYMYNDGFENLEWKSINTDIVFPIQAEDGSIIAPSYSFTNQTNMGLFKSADDTLGIAVAGNDTITLNNYSLIKKYQDESELPTPTNKIAVREVYNNGTYYIQTSAEAPNSISGTFSPIRYAPYLQATNIMEIARNVITLGETGDQVKLLVTGELEMNSTTATFRPPSQTTTERDALTPVAGMVIYNKTLNVLQNYNGSTWVSAGAETDLDVDSITISPIAISGTPSLVGDVFNTQTYTFTDNNTAGSGTATAQVFNSFSAPTLAATNASVTTTIAATVYIEGPPIVGANQTITNPYSLWVDSGNVRFDGEVFVTSNITVSGLVDGRDVNADGLALDNLKDTIGLSALTSAQVDQLENIGTTTISATQWGYLGASNQGIATTDTVLFAQVTVDQIALNDSTIALSGTTGTNVISITDNVADGLTISTAGANFIRCVTTNFAEQVSVLQNLDVTGVISISGTQVLSSQQLAETDAAALTSAALIDSTGGTSSQTLSAMTNVDTLTDSTGGTADNTVSDVSTAVTGADGTDSNAALKTDVDSRLVDINNNFKELVDQIITQETFNTNTRNALASMADEINALITDVGAVRATLNSLLAKLRIHGLIAT
jgi:hypothetical protein